MFPEQILLRGGEGMRDALQTAASKRGVNMNEFMRRCLVEAMEEVGVPVPDHLKKPTSRRWLKRPPQLAA